MKTAILILNNSIMLNIPRICGQTAIYLKIEETSWKEWDVVKRGNDSVLEVVSHHMSTPSPSMCQAG